MNPHVAVSLISFGMFSMALVVASFILGYWFGHDPAETNRQIREFRDHIGNIGRPVEDAGSAGPAEWESVRDTDEHVRGPERRG